MEKNDVKLVLDVNEKPKARQWIFLSIQHVFAMFGATVLVPLLVNQGVVEQGGSEFLSTSVTLVAAGIGTLLYILCTKGKSPVFLGSSFAFITPLIVAYMSGYATGNPKDGAAAALTRNNGGRISLCSSFIFDSINRKKMDCKAFATYSNWPDDYDNWSWII